MQRCFLTIEVSVVFTVGFIVFLVHLTCCLFLFLLRHLSLCFRTSDGKPSFIDSVHDVSSGTIAHMWHHCHSCDIGIFLWWLTLSLQFLLLSWYGGHPSLRSVHIWMMQLSLRFLVLEPSTQVWCCAQLWVWTRDPCWIWNCTSSEGRSRFLYIAPCRWFPLEICVTQHHVYDWCVVVATAIFMDRRSYRQEVRRRHSQRRFADPLSTNEKKGAIHETSYSIQVLVLHALSGPSLCDCLASLSDVFTHLGCMVSRRRYKDILPSTPCLRCRWL